MYRVPNSSYYNSQEFVYLIFFKMENKSETKKSVKLEQPEKLGQKKKANHTKDPAEKSTRRTRRKKDSDQEIILPKQIPKSQSLQLLCYPSIDRQLSKAIIRVPFALWKATVQTRIQSNIIQIKVSKDPNEALTIEAKCTSLHKQTKIQQSPNKNSSIEQIQIQQQIYIVWGKIHWVTPTQIQNKVIKNFRKALSAEFYTQLYKFKPKEVNSDIFIILNIRQQQEISDDYRGLVNQGNTCYMNSYLQMLFHIKEFRNLVYDAKAEDQNKFPATLQNLFYRLQNDQKAVSPQNLVKSFGWSKKQVQVQQDAQQFSCLFFQVLELKLHQTCRQTARMSMGDLFQGQLVHYIECLDVADFRSESRQRFFDIQLSISGSLRQSLDDYITQQILEGDNMYFTQQFGKQHARKGVQIGLLPPMLMIQLKRFQFNPYTMQNEKIMTTFSYPENINFGPWTRQKQDKQYELYGVLVHEGAKAESGHYYAYLKVDEKWYKFNDQIVQQVTKQKVFQYNFGGKTSIYDFDARELRILPGQTTIKSTAYMLVYFDKRLKRKLFEGKSEYPQWINMRNQHKEKQQQFKKEKKSYFHALKILSWRKNFQQKRCDHIGLMTKQEQELQGSQTFEKINRNTNAVEWLKQQKFQQQGLYAHSFHLGKQILVNMLTNAQGLPNVTFNDSLKSINDPVLMLFPIQCKKFNNLVITKLFQVEQDQDDYLYHFDKCFQSPRQIQNSQFLALLSSYYNQQGYEYTFYFQDNKIGLIQIKSNSSFIAKNVPIRNILIIVCIQKRKKNSSVKELQNGSQLSLIQWFDGQWNKKQVKIRSQDKQFQQLRELNQMMRISQLRQYIFKDVVHGNQKYQSAQNIVIKYRSKKNSKVFEQYSGNQSIKKLLKIQPTIVFTPSLLKVEERVSQIQCHLYYRFRDGSFSDEIIVILNKKADPVDVVKQIFNNYEIDTFLKIEKFQNGRIIFLSKDRQYINDIINNKGTIFSKGELVNVIQKQKNSVLVIEGQQDQKGFNFEQDYVILVHHITRTGERLGKPRCLKKQKNTRLSIIRNEILDLITSEEFVWQDKSYSFNPFKVTMTIYAKDITRGIQLTEYISEFEEVNSIMAQESKNQQHKSSQSKKQSSKQTQNAKEKIQMKLCPNTFGKHHILRVVITHMGLSRSNIPLRINVQ